MWTISDVFISYIVIWTLNNLHANLSRLMSDIIIMSMTTFYPYQRFNYAMIWPAKAGGKYEDKLKRRKWLYINTVLVNSTSNFSTVFANSKLFYFFYGVLANGTSYAKTVLANYTSYIKSKECHLNIFLPLIASSRKGGTITGIWI